MQQHVIIIMVVIAYFYLYCDVLNINFKIVRPEAKP